MLHFKGKRLAGDFFTSKAYKCHYLCDYNKITKKPSLKGGQLLIKLHVSEITKTTLRHTLQKLKSFSQIVSHY